MKRKTTHGLNSATLTLLVLGILTVINFIGYRHHQRFDLTKNKSFSLAPQSIKVVKALTEPVTITGFYKAGEKPLFDDLLSKYTYHTKKIKTVFVDPDKDVAAAKRYNVKRYRTIIVEKGKRETRVEGVADTKAEEKLTNAIIKVGREKIPTIYFLTGHQEKSVKDKDREGFSTVEEELKEEGYEIKELSLLSQGDIPSDSDLLVIAGPQKRFLPKEVQIIEAYLKNGGRALVMLDPQTQATGLERFLKQTGVHVQNDMVIDPISTLFGQGAATPVVSQYGQHKIVDELNLASFYPLARSISIPETLPKKEIDVKALASTSPNSWGEKSSRRSKKVKFDKGKEKKGPLTLAAAASGKWTDNAKDEMRVVVFGDSDFANNRSFGFSGNGNFFLNSVAWLVEDETSISIRPSAASMGRFVMTPGEIRGVFILTVVIMPILIMGSGIVVWWRRRRLA